MNLKMKILAVLTLGLLLASCTTSKTSNSGLTSGDQGIATAAATDTASPPTVAAMQSYENDHFSLQYPGALTLYENERPSADGLVFPLDNSMAVQGSDFLVTVTTFELLPGTSLGSFIDSHTECLEVNSSGGQTTTIGNLEGKLYTDTACGLAGSTFFFGLQDNTGYQLVVEAGEPYTAVQANIQPIFDSFQAANQPIDSRPIEHNGISLAYDPALLGDPDIQEVAASADQGMFGQPAPAHTWIGFVPTGIERDSSNHWALLPEAQVIVFHQGDFGSFAPADEQAREKIKTFKALIAERPSAFEDEVPVLPPINAAQSIRAQVKWLDFTGGAGVRFLTAFSQDMSPVTNDRLLYIFFGLTSDGLHGVTAVFPITATGLPAVVQPMTDVEFDTYSQNFDAEMAAVTDRLNSQPDTDFYPLLSQLDALVTSIAINPADTDYPVAAVAPQHAQVLSDTAIYTTPNGEESSGRLPAGEAVVLNGNSADGRRSRILCANGATGDCWVDAEALQVNALETAAPVTYGGLEEGQVVQIQAVTNNTIYAAPADSATVLGRLLSGEVTEVFTPDETGQWLNIACPRNIGQVCWVLADPAVNLPVGFFGGDGWQDISGEYVSFRVPLNWQPTALSPGGGSVLSAWQLGIPGQEYDQDIAFFSVPFAALKPEDLLSETPFEIGGQPGVKWLRSGIGYISYDYYSAGTAGTQAAGAGSFGIHVTVPEADPVLESTMDMLAASVTFRK